MSKQYMELIVCLSVFLFLLMNGISAGLLKDPKIINGTVATLNSVKYQVSIRDRFEDYKSFGAGHKCGGSLISDNVVLTAAHCLFDSQGNLYADQDLIVVMGNHNRLENNSNTLIFDILKSIRGFDKIKLEDDIALIVLKDTVPAKHPTVKPITLNDGPLKNNTICQATGWGQIEDVEDLSKFLRIVDLPVIHSNDCRYKTELGYLIGQGMLCAGYMQGGRDVCVGDSGGPLVCRGIQTGIASWGSDCGKPLNPGVFSDVAYYKNWILKQVSSHNGTLPKFAGVPDGVTRLSCSLVLISLVAILNIILSNLK